MKNLSNKDDNTKKIKVIIAISQGSLGGTERSAIIHAKGLDKKRFSCQIVIAKEIDNNFKKRLENVSYKIVSPNNLASYLQKSNTDVLIDFGILPLKDYNLVKKKTKILKPIVFTNSYSKYADANLFISKTELLKAKLLYGELQKEHVIYFPIEVKKWDDLNKNTNIKPFLKSSKIILGRIGRAEPSKWHFLILATLSYFKKNKAFDKFAFIFVGMPKLYRWYIQIFLRKELHDGDIVILPELVGSQELAKFYKSLDIFFQTAWIGESFGCVIAESFAFKKPVITDWKLFVEKNGKVNINKYDTQIELVEQNHNGFYANHPKTIFEKLVNLDKTSIQQWGQNAFNKCSKLYDEDKVIISLENLIVNLLNENKNYEEKIIHPDKKEIAAFEEKYFKNIKLIERIIRETPITSRITYYVRERLWRCTEYAYLFSRKILRKFNIDIEKV